MCARTHDQRAGLPQLFFAGSERIACGEIGEDHVLHDLHGACGRIAVLVLSSVSMQIDRIDVFLKELG